MHIHRIYESVFTDHLKHYDQMVFVSGPRQSGKTTIARRLSENYLNWDVTQDRRVILAGEEAIAQKAGTQLAHNEKSLIVLDELHHFKYWKRLLKGLYDGYGKELNVIVTGSARLDLVKKSGDSLMGRYFSYHVHPLSVSELLSKDLPHDPIRKPKELDEDSWNRLLEFGGFPDPFVESNMRFWRRWQKLRFEALIREDIRNDTNIRTIDQMEALAKILSERSGEQLVYAKLGQEIQVSELTVKAWIGVLNGFYFGFFIPPWSRSIANAIRKSPKWYLRDWSLCQELGKKHETFVACALLKAIDFLNDLGYGDYGLFYVRNKQGEEVDFLITESNIPWCLIEVKTSETTLSKALIKMHRELKTKHAFQMVFSLEYEDVDCFQYTEPIVVPAKTLLSQLIA